MLSDSQAEYYAEQVIETLQGIREEIGRIADLLEGSQVQHVAERGDMVDEGPTTEASKPLPPGVTVRSSDPDEVQPSPEQKSIMDLAQTMGEMALFEKGQLVVEQRVLDEWDRRNKGVRY